MSKKNKILFPLVFLIIISGGIIRSTFSFWTQNFSQSGENMIASDCFHIILNEEKGILLENSFPMYDKDGKKLTPYTFQVRNQCNRKVKYQLNFETTSNTTLDETYVKFMFQNDEPVLLNKLESTEVTLSNGKSAYVLEQGYMKEEEVRDYQIRIWMDDRITSENQDAMNTIFEGKVTIIASYLKDYDEEKPIANFTYTRENGKLMIDASSSVDQDSNIIKYYYSLDGENFIESTESSYTFEEFIEYGDGIQILKTLYETSLKEIYVKVEDSFRNMSDVVRKNVQELLYDETIDHNLRYVGSDPNNYVLFNNELWRIIGVLKVPEGERIKLVRYENIGAYSFNALVNYTNDYSKSTLMSMLNQGPYYQRTTGTCYASASAGITNPISCDFSNIGLMKESKNMIDSITWNLGGFSSNLLNANQFYSYERGNIVYPGNNTVWKGYIGLIYPSDYFYATKGGNNVLRSECLLNSTELWISKKCFEHDWLYLGNSDMEHFLKFSYLLFNDSVNKPFIYTLSPEGFVSNENGHVNAGFGVYPSLYLKSKVRFISGFGTKFRPYELSLS